MAVYEKVEVVIAEKRNGYDILRCFAYPSSKFSDQTPINLLDECYDFPTTGYKDSSDVELAIRKKFSLPNDIIKIHEIS